MSDIGLVAYPGLTAVGIRVDGTWQTLPQDMPAAWRALFARRAEVEQAATGAGVYVAVSIDATDGWFKEFVGIVIDSCDAPPDGMVVLDVPTNRYLRCVHEGRLRDAHLSFGRLGEAGRERGLTMSEVKLDFGYDGDLSDVPHELFRAIEPARPPGEMNIN